MNARAADIVANTAGITEPVATDPLTPWSKRVRWVGGLTQAAFATFWLLRGSTAIGGHAAAVLTVTFGLAAIGVFTYAIRAAAGTAPRPTTHEDRRTERHLTIATVIEFAAAIVLPVLVSAAGHSDWVLPSIAITIGPLLLWLDHRLCVPRYRPVGWMLTIAPLVLIATLSGTTLVATTGIGVGTLLLATAATGFHDLAEVRRAAAQSELSSALSSVEVQR
jgi:hypothetical protein